MGITFLKVKVINPQYPERYKECEFLVDSGALYSVVDEGILKELGIEPIDTQKFRLANGEIVEKALGNACFEYEGKRRCAPVIFGDEGIFLLGITTIEAFGMIFDPIRRELKPLPMILM